jgi:transposase
LRKKGAELPWRQRVYFFTSTFAMDFINYEPDENESSYETDDDTYGDLQMLVDFDSLRADSTATKMEGVVDDLVIGMGTVTIGSGKTYKNYGPDQIRRFINIMQEEGKSVPAAAKICGIPRSSAYVLFNDFNKSNGTVLPGIAKKPKADTPKKLFPEHTAFLIKLIDENPSTTLGVLSEQLSNNFEGLEISLSGLYQHLKQKCHMSFKQASKYTMERDAVRTLDLRFKVIAEWKAADVDFQKNCVFVDEAGFNAHLMRNRAWAKIGDPAVVKVHTQKGVNLSMIGCISPFGTIDFSKVIPLSKEDAALIEKEFPQQPGSKKRKINDSKQKAPLRKGTTTYHIVKFMEVVMDVLDRHNMKGMFIVMDNCKIHHSRFVVDLMKERGYKPLYMPPYSPFLNPIEECWAKIKSQIRRNPLSKDDVLSDRIAEACKTITIDDCQGWIRHAETYWDRCLQKEIGLK